MFNMHSQASYPTALAPYSHELHKIFLLVPACKGSSNSFLSELSKNLNDLMIHIENSGWPVCGPSAHNGSPAWIREVML